MNPWQTPITDRVASDITNRTAKAFFNVADWLRVYGNSEIVNALTNVYLALSIPFTELTEPTVTTFPTAAEINSLIENIDLCRAAACLPSALGVETLDYAYTEGAGGTVPDYTDVNAWEADLALVREYLATAVDYRVYCGVAGCGQPRFYQNRWRRYPWTPTSPTQPRRPRCSVATCGASLTRQNGFRRYA